MSATATTPTRRPSKKNSTKRSPLQERTLSQRNEISRRLPKDPSNDSGYSSIYSSTPFPIKPAHVLLPSTVKKQRTARGTENDVSEFLHITRSGPPASRPASRAAVASRDGSESGRSHTLTLKRSVTALRDMYEAQTEKSRPTTATSPPLSPIVSSRLRAVSSSEGLAGRYARSFLPQISSEDLSLLPSLDEAVSAARGSTVRRIESQSSCAVRATNLKPSSSPNYRRYGPSSSPKLDIYREVTVTVPDIYGEVTVPDVYREVTVPVRDDTAWPTDSIQDSGLASSPNFVRLGRSSSIDDSGDTEQSSSSPNVIKLGSSSPSELVSEPSTISPGRSRSNSPKKRKRADTGPGLFSTRTVVPSFMPSSPPYNSFIASNLYADLASPTPQAGVMSSPAKSEMTAHYSINEATPEATEARTVRISPTKSPVVVTHGNLQSILSSSPGPTIHYPIVTAPVAPMGALSVPKRNSKSTEGGSVPRWSVGVSTIHTLVTSNQSQPSSQSSSKNTSKRSSIFREELDDFKDSRNEYARVTPFTENGPPNFSQSRPVLDDHHHEATDELSALPGYLYKSPPMRLTRSISHLGTIADSSRSNSLSQHSSARNSMDGRLNSLKSLTQQVSLRSMSLRPSSSAGSINNFAQTAPSWARRYYSGIYLDSHHYLYKMNEQALSNTNLVVPSRPTTARRTQSWTSLASFKNSFQEVVMPIVRPRNRPHLEARKSHGTPGIGPLVSNPVRPGSAVVRQHKRSDSGSQPTVRRVSAQLPPADPRAHWAGLAEELEKTDESPMSPATVRHHYQDSIAEVSSQYSYLHSSRFPRVSRLAGYSPHLHHDQRLNTGSSTSRGFGYPFNQKPRWSKTGPSLPHVSGLWDSDGDVGGQRRHLGQIALFVLGFGFPPAWFCASVLPLPSRPDSFNELEKNEWQRHSGITAGTAEEFDVVAKLRMERHNKGLEEVRWQSTKWWRTLNRFMSVVGIIICILVIVLVAVGTSFRW